MSNGEPIVVRVAVKPVATLRKPLDSVDLATGRAGRAHIERSDVAILPRAAVVGEAMVALVLADALLATFGGDTMGDLRRRRAASTAALRGAALMLSAPSCSARASATRPPRRCTTPPSRRWISLLLRARDFPPTSCPAVLAALRRRELAGANVTQPHKAAVVPLLEELTPAARRWAR